MMARLSLYWLAFLMLVMAFTCAAEDCFVILKTGDEAATQENAAQFLADLSQYLNSHVPFMKARPVHGLITNDPAVASQWIPGKQPVLAFVTPAFYLEHLSGGTAVPLRQVPRFGASVEHYFLVTAKSGPAAREALKGKTVRTLAFAEASYLSRVVFPADFQPGRQFTLQPASNMADEVFLLTENEKGAADALLFDEELLHFFKTDDLTWPLLRVIWTSGDLPRDLVVVLPKRNTPEEIQQIEKALDGMNRDAEGARLLQLMQTSGFQPVNRELLGQAEVRMQKGHP